MGVIFVELWVVLNYCLITDGSSLNQSAFPAKTVGFFFKFLIVPLNLSAKTARRAVFIEDLLRLWLFKYSLKVSFTYSLP